MTLPADRPISLTRAVVATENVPPRANHFAPRDLAFASPPRPAPRAMSAAPASRVRALSLMRQMLRMSRGWSGEGGLDEAIFIVNETRKAFRERRHLRGAEAERALEEGEERLEMARHYNIAYPRMPHVPLSGGGDVKNVLPPAERGSSADTWAAHVGDEGVAEAFGTIAAGVAPVNPAMNAARAKARAKRLAMSRATRGALASEEGDESGGR